jgi:hypothetical protein
MDAVTGALDVAAQEVFGVMKRDSFPRFLKAAKKVSAPVG